MLAVWKRELRSFFSSMTAYVLLAVLTLAAVIFAAVYNLLYASATLAYPISAMRILFCICIPFLTAQAVTRERARGTDLLLASLPLRTGEILLGKYFAVMTVLLLPLAGLALLPLLLLGLGEIALGSAYVAWLGLLLFVAAISAVCFFLASLTQRVWLARLLGLGAGGLFFLLGLWEKPFPSVPALRALLEGINPYVCIGELLSGFFDLSALLALLSVTVLFLILARLAWRKPARFPKKRRVLLSSAVGAGALAILLLCNVALSFLPFSVRTLRADRSDVFTVCADTLEELSALEEDVTLYWFVEGGERSADKDVYSYLLNYVNASSHLRLEILDSNDPGDFAKRHSAASMEDMTLVVEGPERYQEISVALDLTYYQNSMLGLTLSAVEYQTSLLAYQSGNKDHGYYAYGQYLSQPEIAVYTQAYFDGNATITRAVRFVAAEEVPYVGIWSGKNASLPETSFLSMMQEYGYGVSAVPDLTKISEVCDLLIIYSPTEDLTQEEAEGLRQYLSNGGKLLLSTSPGGAERANLMSVLAEFGLSPVEGLHIVAEGDPNYFVYGEDFAYPYYIWAHIAQHAVSASFASEFLVLNGHAIETESRDGVTVTPLLYTSSKGYIVTYPDKNSSGVPSEQTDKHVMGALAERGDSAVLWIASSGALSDYANVQSQGGNYTLLHSCMDYLMGISTETLSIEGRLMTTPALRVTVGNLTVFCLIGLAIPVGILTFGALHCKKRRRQSAA